MKIENPDTIKSILDEMEISHPTLKERTLGLLEGRYETPENLNCIGTALFVLGQNDKPTCIEGDYRLLIPYLMKARKIIDKKESGDFLINHFVCVRGHLVDHTSVYLGRHNGEELIFQKYYEKPYSIQAFQDLIKDFSWLLDNILTIYRFA